MQLGSIGRLARLLLIAAPPLLIGFLILRDGVDTPFWDEWDGTAPLFEKMAAGTLGFADFFAQHNQHRILFPRLIFFGLGRLTHWNIRAELFVSWFLALICLFNIWQMTRRSGWKDSTHSFWILFSSSVLLFSPLNHDNFLWGFQIGFLLPLACVTGCIWVATLSAASFRFRVLNRPVHHLHVFDRERLSQLVADHAPLDAGASALNIVQKMVGHLDSHILI